uniref:Pre-mRNA polyadenylation factor Fip1 domain-containing protein n=1 Tax=Meloidogyne enterolobii TaxID=390850 RepID=A0A6V7WFV7_MELEN|nr:unnamed protein product [Meloidogyne enterolobii]
MTAKMMNFDAQLEMIKQMFLFKSGVTNGTIDLDTNPTLKDGTPIYDLDLATMEDKPWKKPGADLIKLIAKREKVCLVSPNFL